MCVASVYGAGLRVQRKVCVCRCRRDKGDSVLVDYRTGQFGSTVFESCDRCFGLCRLAPFVRTHLARTLENGRFSGPRDKFHLKN